MVMATADRGQLATMKNVNVNGHWCDKVASSPVSLARLFETTDGGIKGAPVGRLLDALCGMLLLSAWESARAAIAEPTGHPLWEFFFHLRNGVAHGNAFEFRNSQPKHDARWRGLEISALAKGSKNALSGKRVFCQTLVESGGPAADDVIMQPADLLWFLADVHRIFFEGTGGQVRYGSRILDFKGSMGATLVGPQFVAVDVDSDTGELLAPQSGG